MKTRKVTLFVATALLLSVLIWGCKKDNPSPAPSGNQVYMENTAFTPSSLTVPVNTTVTWTNMDNFDHTVTSDSSVFDAGTVHSGGTFSFQFTKTGNYPYHCNFHNSMHGTVVVQ